MTQTIAAYILSHYIELLGFFFGVIYVIMAIRENPWCWIAGIVNVGMYMVVFYQSRLYGAAVLQVIYLAMSVYGLLFWMGIGSKKEKHVPAITHTPPRLWLLLIILMALGSAVLGILLSYTDNSIPYWDGITTAMGLTATWMAARKYLQNWMLWIVNDILCTIIYGSQGLYLTMALYLFLGIMAIVGYLQWRRKLQSSTL